VLFKSVSDGGQNGRPKNDYCAHNFATRVSFDN